MLRHDPRCFEARRQFVVDKQKEALLTERRIVRSDAIHPTAPNAEWTPAESPSWKEQPRREAFKERRRLAVKSRGKGKPEKPLPAPKIKSTSVKAAVNPVPAAKKPTQQLQQTAVQAKKAAKTAVELLRRAAGLLRRAVTALISALAGLVGGSVVLAALAVIIIIAAVAGSPFGLFFAAERSAPNTVSVAEAVTQVNIAYNAKLEELQAGDYDSIDIQGQAPDWPEVLAVFAAKTAGAEDGVDVATLDRERVERLTAVFWDMTEITSWVETIDHPGSDDNDGWTEYILHITITPKTADEMRTAYAYTRYQNEALDELLAESGSAGFPGLQPDDHQFGRGASASKPSGRPLPGAQGCGSERIDALRKSSVLLGRKEPRDRLGFPLGRAAAGHSRRQLHHRHLSALRA